MKKPENLQPNMISMIDFVMLLLVFFMVTAKFRGTEADILSLAYARNADRVEVSETTARFVINVKYEETGVERVVFTVQGAVFDPESGSAMDKLGDNLRAFRFQQPKGQIVVRVDRRIEYRYVRKLQTLLRDKLGVSREKELTISYAVDQNPPEQ
jgi:biopolymer transport protein ExbD